MPQKAHIMIVHQSEVSRNVLNKMCAVETSWSYFATASCWYDRKHSADCKKKKSHKLVFMKMYGIVNHTTCCAIGAHTTRPESLTPTQSTLRWYKKDLASV